MYHSRCETIQDHLACLQVLMAEVRARQTAVESAERRTGALRDEAKVQVERLVRGGGGTCDCISGG